MAEQSRQFKSMWRKNEPAPEHVIDRAVKDIAAERRGVSNDLIHLVDKGEVPNTPVSNAIMARANPVSSPNMEGRSISGANLSRADHFAKAALDYTHKWKEDQLPEGYWNETTGEENTPDYPKGINWGNK